MRVFEDCGKNISSEKVLLKYLKASKGLVRHCG